MDRSSILTRLRSHEAELRGLGVARLSLFGSMARGDAGTGSDVDLAAEVDHSRRLALFHYSAIAERLEQMLGAKVDLLTEPARKLRMQVEIDRDRVHVFQEPGALMCAPAKAGAQSSWLGWTPACAGARTPIRPDSRGL